jgi:RHS repeat-associated protein
VHIYAHEYRVYGPDGLRVLFERNAQGVFVKRAVTLDAQGSIATVTDAAGYQHAEIHDDHGERTTVPQRRTGWLDRELDYETAPGHVRHKLYDLDHRKYDGATAQFLSVDPLWPMFISSGSYVYCTGDAVNKVDPWGLGEDIMPRPRSPQTSPQPGTGTSPLGPGTDSPMIVGHDDEYDRGVGVWLYDIAIGRYLRGLGATGDGIGPHGSGPGQSWVAPPWGIGPGGKEGVGFWSGRGATPETAVQLKRVVVSDTRIISFSLPAMYLHFQKGGGREVTIDMATIDLTGTTQRELGIDGLAINKEGKVNLFNAGPFNQAALAFGNVSVMNHGNNQFSIVNYKGANFDFSPLIDPNASWRRDAGNLAGLLICYSGWPLNPLVPLFLGGGYYVSFIGTTYIPR